LPRPAVQGFAVAFAFAFVFAVAFVFAFAFVTVGLALPAFEFFVLTLRRGFNVYQASDLHG
jgi:hypothetical protein